MSFYKLKRIITSVILAILLTLPSVVSAEEVKSSANQTPTEITATFAINNSVAFWNHNQITITPPVTALGKTYIDLYSVAWLFGYDINWISDNGGSFQISMNGSNLIFRTAADINELASSENKLFAKDSKIYVSLKEIADFAGLAMTESNGIIHIGFANNLYDSCFPNQDLTSVDEYIKNTYPPLLKHIVYPYTAYSYETMLNDASELQKTYPDLIKTSVIGKSVENRDLLLIEFGKGPVKIFVCGTHHAREYISTTYLMYAIDRYAYAYQTNDMWGRFNPRQILDQVTFCIVPMVNPDGVNLVQNGIYSTLNPSHVASMGIYESPQYGYRAWKANVRGVDVNWNYNKDWNIKKNKNPRGSTGFNGDYPKTEPETAAVSDYVDSQVFEAFLSFHTQGQIFYWADNKSRPTGIYTAIKNETGFPGYEEECTGVGGSFFDYVFRKYQKPTVTFELCPYVGNYPYPDADFDRVWKPVNNALFLVANEILYAKSIYGN